MSENIKFEESGMNFVAHPQEQLFRIEKSKLYLDQLAPNKVKTVEFLLYKMNKLLFVEAKTSTPNYHNCADSYEKKENYERFIGSIAQKFTDSISLYMSAVIGRQDNSEFPTKMLESSVSKTEIRLIVIIKEADLASCTHYTDKRRTVLHANTKKWSNCTLLCLNEEMARKKKLII